MGKENPELGKLVKLLSKVQHKDEATSFREVLDPAAFLPSKFVTYPLKIPRLKQHSLQLEVLTIPILDL